MKINNKKIIFISFGLCVASSICIFVIVVWDFNNNKRSLNNNNYRNKTKSWSIIVNMREDIVRGCLGLGGPRKKEEEISYFSYFYIIFF